MSKDYGIAPSLEHYACIIDLFGRAGQLERALEMVRNMPETPDLAVWLTLLGACRKWGHVNLAKQVFEHVVQVDGRDPSAYIFMANIFADAGMKEEAKNIDVIRVENARLKET
jgi:pentatricopeptide repeat protein